MKRNRGGPMRSIYFAYASLLDGVQDWSAACRHAAGLGFEALSTRLERNDVFAEQVCPGMDVARLIDLAGENGLALLLDLRLDKLPAEGRAARDLGLDAAQRERDPRRSPADRDFQILPADARTRWAELLGERLAALADSGVAGFRCLAPHGLPPGLLRQILGRARDGKAAAFIAAPGSFAAAEALPAEGFAAVTLPGAALLAAAPPSHLDEATGRFPHLIAEAETPFGPRMARVAGDAQVAERQSTLALWTAASLFDGLMVPMGFEYGLRERVAAAPPRTRWPALRAAGAFDLSEEIVAANAFVKRAGERRRAAPIRLLAPQSSPVRLALRAEPEEGASRLVIVNRALDHAASLEADGLAREFGEYLPFRDLKGSGPDIAPDSILRLRPAEVRIMTGRRAPAILSREPEAVPTAEAAVTSPRLAIEAVTPSIDGGRYVVKRIVGETLHVEADAYGEGHDPIAVALKWRSADEAAWREKRMKPLGNDRWGADLPLTRLGRYFYSVETWRDEFAVFRSELVKKHDAGLAVPLELEEGRRLIVKVLKLADGTAAARLQPIAAELEGADDARRLEILLAATTTEAMKLADPRPFRLGLPQPLAVDAERKAAGFASWYELFPRSQSGDPTRHGTFDDVIARLPAIRDMGFDVVYFPPIHPIGATNRKGRNNSLKAAPDDPGSPYAIGSPDGGHEAIHPELGSFEDFRRLIAAAAALGLEVALDLAIQASPDHPWLKEHPEWFDWRPDGTIRYAENPPKKYEDIVNVDFYTPGAMPSLWTALRDVIRVWIDQGVRLFRVDNPHTKPFPFWEWVIGEVRHEHPDAIFLSEAFTRPKVMYRLAKIGFSQSYTYFTWRNAKWELTQYLEEITKGPPKDFFRPHFFVNTHDINPDFLQNAPRPAFLIRAALATTLSGLWGMYNGFELCEGRPDAKKKEYANSEKYELTAWDWDRPGNIIAEITALNRIRRENPALHSHLGISFLVAWNENILYFEKASAGRDNVVLVAISLDPHRVQEADIELPLWNFGLGDDASLAVEDLVRGTHFTWTGKAQHIRLDPREHPYSIWRLSRREGF